MIVSQVDVTGIREVEQRLGRFKSQAPVAMYRAKIGRASCRERVLRLV